MIPNILSIAGSDPSGGAGIQADLKAISANGGYGMAAITALTAQNTMGVVDVQTVKPEFVVSQIHAVLSDITVHAIKIGMLGTSAVTQAVATALQDVKAPIVLDPVMVAKGGDRLLSQTAVSALRDVLLSRATLITPNLPEAADILETSEAQTRDDMLAQAKALLAFGPKAVFLKGGHLEHNDSPDLLLDNNGAVWFEAVRVATPNTHGTGCTLSSALATQLALKTDLNAACQAAKSYIQGAIAAADDLSVGHGHGPTDHFFALRG